MNEEHETSSSAEQIDSGAQSAPEADSETAQEDLVDQLNQQIAALKDEVLRTRAEAENVRKRAERDVEAAHKYGYERLVQELLPVKDSMDLGLAAAAGAGASGLEALQEGMALTAKMFDDFFTKLNVRVIDPMGERFDPEFHQAMTTEESVEVAPGTVLRVMQNGYVLNDRLVRPALVVVSRAAG